MRAKFFICCFWVSIITVVTPANAQKEISYNLSELFKTKQLETNALQQTEILENSLPGAISTKGVLWFKTFSFDEGVIDIDLRGKNVFLQSFLGIAFHGIDSLNYDVIYFRPFNFRHPDSLRRKWSVQYMSLPDYPYDKLRKDKPGIYENSVTPVPDPVDWFHARVVIKEQWITVYVNHNELPSLHVHLLNDWKGGKFGLWDDGLSGDFANLRIAR